MLLTGWILSAHVLCSEAQPRAATFHGRPQSKQAPSFREETSSSEGTLSDQLLCVASRPWLTLGSSGGGAE